ncbi:hypothetical protein PGTUg99_000146 [Puccinia graminis f. sp. tritici]|uniref:Uncharacterized protein n=1 Tax=Puccinia graminis f. sp. tritici TaxID=56615 RepID=A0A5B0Q7L5_PUCGR|nr:hypothetical protein PGTUg99_000146 [Puccinia graminis f. sp. tritici]
MGAMPSSIHKHLHNCHPPSSFLFNPDRPARTLNQRHSTQASNQQKTNPEIAELDQENSPPSEPLIASTACPPKKPRKIAGFKRKSSASPSPELHPENNNHLHQSNDAPNRRTSSAWGLSSSPHSTGNIHLIHSQDYHQSSYYPTQPQNFKALPSEACESVPSSLAGLLSTTHHPGAPRPPTEPHQIDVPDPTPVEISMSRRDPNRSRGRATINKPSTSQINPPDPPPFNTPLIRFPASTEC